MYFLSQLEIEFKYQRFFKCLATMLGKADYPGVVGYRFLVLKIALFMTALLPPATDVVFACFSNRLIEGA